MPDWARPNHTFYLGCGLRTGSCLVSADDRTDGPKAKRGGILLGGLLLVAVALSLPGGQACASDAARRVLILHSYNYTFPATSLVSDAVRKRLLEQFPQQLEIDSEFLDLAKHPDAAH